MSGRCRVCGRRLVSEKWAALGVGPVCARATGVIAPAPPRPFRTGTASPTAPAPAPGQTTIPIQEPLMFDHPAEPGTAPAPLPPELVNAIVRDETSPYFPSRITVFCDGCGTEVTGEYMVSAEQTSSERLEGARAHCRSLGWSCTPETGDHCPNHTTTKEN
ncbi:DUF6011 domain-containing protein [Streptomyces sp. BH097]|uniref:DUF6011 domain-containing protein n=1 Tax=Streptomyces sp. BH097 TaxID=3410406 RepID=UPI003CF79536